MAVVTRHPTGTNDVLRIAGAFVAIFSLVMGMLILFVIPGACSFVGSLELLMLGFLFILGVIAFLWGTAVSWNGRRR
jgi:hypothetical protein